MHETEGFRAGRRVCARDGTGSRSGASDAAGRGTAGPPAGRGGGRGGPPLVSPEVKADNTVTFRFRAPNAQQVTLIGELDGKTYPMTKDEAGVWSVTIGPLAPDVYNYQFNVDGVIAMDPVNPAVKLGFRRVPAGEHVRDPRRRVRRREERAARDGAGRDLSLEDDGRAAHDLGLHAARLRVGQHPLSGVLPAARLRQHRQQLDADRPRELHHGQPDRRGEDQADDHRQSARLRAAGRQPRAGTAGRPTRRPARRPGSAAAWSARICWTM